MFLSRASIAAVFAAATLLPPAIVQAEEMRYKRWEEIFAPHYTKPLPPGYFDFISLPPDAQQQRFLGEGAVFCGHWRNAISYGKRIALGYSPSAAVDDIIRDRDGEMVCGFVEGLVVSPLRIAVRGDDANNKIWIVEWKDQQGSIHYTGSPKTEE